MALLQERSFKADDFARLHPGGSLGRKLLTRVSDVMGLDALRVLSPTANMREAIVLLAEQRGIAIVVEKGQVAGVITAGDLTRLLEREQNVFDVPVHKVMTSQPRMARDSELGSAVVRRMEQQRILAMPVVDEADLLVGVVHLHDLLRAGAA